ncbi:DUF2147 domain-containing protein [Flavobacterium branchiarum]|uniref:DUF2147 domain-containing protein n=1 Tax=Flavobacterium branchiarum TaxID=1114870 RepID=A0ABV5FNK9_9FLAO|nr:DUF2147 domain-containing protein [Flavobacterium branchiarum]MDN3671997.1 DUF2147 domain-containing protein [Flavobacterium branchiarum]
MQQSVNFSVIFLTAFLFFICSAYGQTNEDKFTGKWLSKDKMIVEVYKAGKGFNIKQLESPKPKEKKNNGKVVAKNILETSKGEYKGTSIDLTDDKEYQSIWIISDEGKSLTFKLKWGFIWHSESWTKF